MKLLHFEYDPSCIFSDSFSSLSELEKRGASLSGVNKIVETKNGKAIEFAGGEVAFPQQLNLVTSYACGVDDDVYVFDGTDIYKNGSTGSGLAHPFNIGALKVANPSGAISNLVVFDRPLATGEVNEISEKGIFEPLTGMEQSLVSGRVQEVYNQAIKDVDFGEKELFYHWLHKNLFLENDRLDPVPYHETFQLGTMSIGLAIENFFDFRLRNMSIGLAVEQGFDFFLRNMSVNISVDKPALILQTSGNGGFSNDAFSYTGKGDTINITETGGSFSGWLGLNSEDVGGSSPNWTITMDETKFLIGVFN